jgi:signal transduction histidine kinase
VETKHSSPETDELLHAFNSLMNKVNTLVGHLRHTLASLAHDIRTPITRLQTQMQVTLTDHTSERELRAVMQDALEETSHVVSLLQRFLDASEAESGAVSLNRQLVPLRELYTGVVEAYRVAAEERNIEIRCEEPATSIANRAGAKGGNDGADAGARDDESSYAYVDPVRVRQALGNLLDNAVKFSPADATIVFRIEHTARSLQFGISDEGPGISEDTRSIIWSARARAEHEDGNPASGYGLGLTIVRAVAEAHGGSVDVRSRVGEGSTFVLRLPLEAGETRSASPATSLHASDT